MIADPFLLPQNLIHNRNLPISGIDMIEIFHVHALRALHIPFQFGRVGKQNKQLKLS